MKFLLFSKISFSISNPIALIESYCFQSNFYLNFDLKENKTIDDVNKIGARIKREALIKCKDVVNTKRSLNIFNHDLDSLLSLSEETRNSYIDELGKKMLKELLEISGIGFSKASKVLHTLYPEIMPMIDKPLQDLYKNKINPNWSEDQPNQIFIDYYHNLKEETNRENLNKIYSIFNENNIPGLTKVRIFDILWWSYLKAKRLRDEKNINWSTIS